MKQRTKQPKNNKYYIRKVNGGNNGAVQGYPVAKGANVLSNCVGFANGRFNEVLLDPNLKGIELKFKYQLICNAENFIESAKKQGLKTSKTPTLGGIMVWKKGATLSERDGAGHVAVVEQINEDGSIVTSESGYNSYAFKRIKRNDKNGRWGMSGSYSFRGCIVNPSIGASPATSTKDNIQIIEYKVKKGDTLSAIAKKYGTTFQKIAKDNGIKDPNKIIVGQKLKIKVEK